jgi:predicted site-specific integrase-resolvase
MSHTRNLPSTANGPKLQPRVGAVIYIRVSTKEQTENLSLPTQLKACEEYCQRQGFEVLERFREEGESAKTADRTELQSLLKYCRTHKGKVRSSSCSTSRASRARSTTISPARAFEIARDLSAVCHRAD